MKKKLLAILLSASMVVCLMPTMAFADVETPTEEAAPTEAVDNTVLEKSEEEVAEPVVEPEASVAEQVEEVKEEATEETKEEKSNEVATMQGGADLEALKIPTGKWDGYKFKFDNPTQISDAVYSKLSNGAVCKPEDSDGSILGETYAVSGEIDKVNGVIDFTNTVNTLFSKGYEYCFVAITGLKMGKITVASFYSLNTNITVEKAAIKDTTFVYDFDSQISLVTIKENDLIQKSTNPSYEWIDGSNNVVLKKGTKAASSNMILRVDGMNYVDLSTWDMYYQYLHANPEEADASGNPVANVIKMVSNDGGYDIDNSKWAFASEGLFNLDKLGTVLNIDPTQLQYIDLGQFGDDVDAFVKAINEEYAKTGMDGTAALIKCLTAADQMSFYCTGGEVEKTAKKGVQTGDSNALGLWIALGMFASVAAAGYALKRREN